MSFTVSANTGMVLGHNDPVDAIEHAAALNLEAVEFWDVSSADPDALDAACERYSIDVSASTCVGVASNTGASGPSITNPALHEDGVADIERSIDMGREVGAESLIVTVGPERESLPPGTEHRAIVNVLRDVAPAAERANIDLVVEPLNNPVDHTGYYLDSSYEAYSIVNAVDSDHVKVLFDIYHQQITEGNVIENLTEHIEFVGYVHVADVPGRHEPGTGELNYERIFERIADTGYDGYVGLEYAPASGVDETVEHVLGLVP
jgi:hydroxypyruvate isomerase